MMLMSPQGCGNPKRPTGGDDAAPGSSGDLLKALGTAPQSGGAKPGDADASLDDADEPAKGAETKAPDGGDDAAPGSHQAIFSRRSGPPRNRAAPSPAMRTHPWDDADEPAKGCWKPKRPTGAMMRRPAHQAIFSRRSGPPRNRAAPRLQMPTHRRRMQSLRRAGRPSGTATKGRQNSNGEHIRQQKTQAADGPGILGNRAQGEEVCNRTQAGPAPVRQVRSLGCISPRHAEGGLYAAGGKDGHIRGEASRWTAW